MFILFSICVFILFIILLVFYFLPENSKIFNIDIWHTNKRLIYDSESDSNNIFDIYSVSHFFHGILFFFIFKLLGFNINTVFILSLISEILWEIIEINPKIINILFKNDYPDYKGDAFVNIIGDILIALFGVFFAYSMPWVSIFTLIFVETFFLFYNKNYSLFYMIKRNITYGFKIIENGI